MKAIVSFFLTLIVLGVYVGISGCSKGNNNSSALIIPSADQTQYLRNWQTVTMNFSIDGQYASSPTITVSSNANASFLPANGSCVISGNSCTVRATLGENNDGNNYTFGFAVQGDASLVSSSIGFSVDNPPFMVVVGDNGVIFTSPDGTVWTQRTSGAPFHLNGVTYANGKFVVVGDEGEIFTSSNETGWTPQTSGSASYFQDVTYAKGLFVAVGGNGVILTSPNGTDWTPQTSGTTSFLKSVTYADGRFVVVGEQGEILTSLNGTDWTPQTSGVNSYLQDVTYGDGRFVAVGEGNVILTSLNGTD